MKKDYHSYLLKSDTNFLLKNEIVAAFINILLIDLMHFVGDFQVFEVALAILVAIGVIMIGLFLPPILVAKHRVKELTNEIARLEAIKSLFD